jgi:hypothetical protein
MLVGRAIVLAFGIAVLSPLNAVAAPAEISDVIHADTPFGQGPYRFLLVTAYTAQLWTDASHWSVDVPFALTLDYKMHFSTDEMVSRTREEMKHVDPGLSDDAISAYAERLKQAFPPVGPGDRITALNVPGAPTRFYRDGVLTATIDDPKMNADFFGIWLSPRSSAPALRAALVRTGG